MQRGSWEEAIGVDDLEKYPAMPYLDEGYIQIIPGGRKTGSELRRTYFVPSIPVCTTPNTGVTSTAWRRGPLGLLVKKNLGNVGRGGVGVQLPRLS